MHTLRDFTYRPIGYARVYRCGGLDEFDHSYDRRVLDQSLCTSLCFQSDGIGFMCRTLAAFDAAHRAPADRRRELVTASARMYLVEDLFVLACARGLLAAAQWLYAVEYRLVHVGAKDYAAMCCACSEGHLAVVQWLAALPGHELCTDEVPRYLALAVSKGRDDVAAWLADYADLTAAACDRIGISFRECAARECMGTDGVHAE